MSLFKEIMIVAAGVLFAGFIIKMLPASVKQYVA